MPRSHYMNHFVQGSWCNQHGDPIDWEFEAAQRAIATKGHGLVEFPRAFDLADMVDQPEPAEFSHRRTPEEGMEELSRWADEQLGRGSIGLDDLLEDLF